MKYAKLSDFLVYPFIFIPEYLWLIKCALSNPVLYF